ncbi:MAG: hypothetical protein ACRER2_18445 [Methylococcales bacterium]
MEDQIKLIQLKLIEINEEINIFSPGYSSRFSTKDTARQPTMRSKTSSQSRRGITELSDSDEALVSTQEPTYSGRPGGADQSSHNKRFKEALLGCAGVNKERLEKEFDEYYRGPRDLENMLRRLLEKWLSRPALPKTVFDSISQTLNDATQGRASLVVPEIRSRYDETRHEAIHYVSLPSGAPGEILKIFKPGILIDDEQVTLALVELSQ